jgi:hypothetical protein
VVKRLLLPASALVLVLTASGAIANAAPRTKDVGAQSVAAQRERAALREADTLMHEFVPPPGARATRTPPGYRSVHVLRQSTGRLAEEAASIHRFWTVRTPLKAVAAFVRAHRLRGFGHFGALWYTRKPHYLAMGSSWPAAPDSIPRRYFSVTVVALPHITVLRVDARVVWVYPRSPSEKVPSGVRMIDIHIPQRNRVRIVRVINRPKLTRIIRWFDALPISPPGVEVPCFGGTPGGITLSFRSARGAVLARTTVPRTSASVCQPIAFKIGGHTQTPLIDGFTRTSFTSRLGQLLGLRLIDNYRE